jgi:hypothetical protein
MTTSNAIPNGVTVLTAFRHSVVKIFELNQDTGDLKKTQYTGETDFKPKVHVVQNIEGLGGLVSDLSREDNVIIIRGQPNPGIHGHVRRIKDNYSEPTEGLHWAMLDFDDIALPEGQLPTSIDAIEWLIEKLPEPFHDASYFYQFSSSTGILNTDGILHKRGLNVHLFFWFARPISSSSLTAYLKGHCIAEDFLSRTFNSDGLPVIKYGVDFAVLRTVQPHYISAPKIMGGVICTLSEVQRQGLIKKAHDAIVLPELEPGLGWQVEREHHRILDEYKRSCGWVSTKSLTKGKGTGIAIAKYYRNPNPSPVATGRQLLHVEETAGTRQEEGGQVVKFARLYFADESSPGSWYVKSTNPTIARRFGDYEAIHLQELSSGAYEYVRDTLGWFSEISTQYLSLTAEGFLPDIPSFATARNCLILAPTGSGKTFAFCRFAMAQDNRRKIIIYAAQTRALVRQMEADLRAAQVPVVHYEHFNRYEIHPGVYVTTNQSLVKIVEAVTQNGSNYLLVIDEAHIALDDFMKSDRKNRLLDRAINRAERTLFMTATITDVQLKKLTEAISVATGEMTSQNFGYYQFQPVKRNHLWWAEQANFWTDFVALLRHYQSLKNAGEEIPRTIIIAPTSKMEPFRLLLEWFDLLDQAEVVSRLESIEDEIEEARVGTQPILISSPLFALGLNFNLLPRVFWTYFKYIQVDESQIIQTLNRANRDANPCEVRLYAGSLDASPYWIPDETKEKLRISEYFREEASIEGMLDSHFQISRVTYEQLRIGEKVTAKALYRLKADNAIQNYTIVEDWTEWLISTDDDKNVADTAIAEAKERYDEAILILLDRYEDETQALLLNYLDDNYKDSKDFHNKDRLQKEFADKEIALSMVLTQTDDVRIGTNIEPFRLRRLLGDAMVFLSSQFESGRYKDWMRIASTKTGELVPLVLALELLKAGSLDGVKFGWSMRQKVLRRAILASANSHNDYVRWEKRLDQLDAHFEEYRLKAGDRKREKLDDAAFAVARTFLGTVGIYFEKSKGADGRVRFDPEKPVLPDWNFTSMVHRLLVKAASLKVLPEIPIDKYIEDQKWANGNVSNELCRRCVHCEPHFICAVGRSIQPDWKGYEADTHECDRFRKVPVVAQDRADLPASC